jgi:hypothetical protein
MICSNAILTGIGVGKQASTVQDVAWITQLCQANRRILSALMLSQAASPLAAVFQFFVRDLAGMCGGVLFAFIQVRITYTHVAIPYMIFM